MFLKDVIIEENMELKPGNFLLSFRDSEIAGESKIGQFLELKAGSGNDNLLRKPISINDVEGDLVTIIYRVVGKGTDRLSQYKKGDKFSVLGPLGNSFPVIKDKEVLIVAGGIGCGPFSYVMRTLPNWKIFYGIKDACEFLLEDELKAHEKSGKAFITTDNGSYGDKGFVTQKLENYIKENGTDKVIFACGPEVMMKAVGDIAVKYSMEAYLSLEEYMGCGIGACVGCVKKIKNPSKKDGWEYKKVCKDGPIFRADEVIWE